MICSRVIEGFRTSGVAVTREQEAIVTSVVAAVMAKDSGSGSNDLLNMDAIPRTVRPESDPLILRLFGIFNRRPSRKLTSVEQRLVRQSGITEEDVELIERFYNDPHEEWDGKDYRKTSLEKMLRSWQQELDRATAWAAFGNPLPKPKQPFSKLI